MRLIDPVTLRENLSRVVFTRKGYFYKPSLAYYEHVKKFKYDKNKEKSSERRNPGMYERRV